MLAILPYQARATDGSWLDADFFLRGTWFARSTDEKVALLNNYWHELQRSASSAGLRDTPEFRRLQADMGNWWTWKQSYDESAFRRAASAIAQLWGGGLQSQYERELGAWKDRYVEDLNAILAIAPPTVPEALVNRGVDPDLQFQQFPSADAPDGSIWVGVGVVVLLVGFGAWSSYRMRGPRG